ncbi:MAG: fimbrillin family protein [Prevotella sp.]|nr:fimbrillin family protein [Prevotella sp.]
MKTRILLSAFAALALLSACNSDDKQQASSQNDDGRVPILLSSGIGDDTRASQGLQNTQFRKNQTLDVQITSQDNMTGYDMLTYFASDNAGTLQPLKGVFPYYPTNGSAVDIRAIYPTGYMNSSSFSVTKISQTSPEAYMASDLMFAKVEGITAQSTAVPLVFQHKMTKICVNLTGEGGVTLTNSTVKLMGVKTETTFNPLTGVVRIEDAAGASSNILMTTNGAQGCAAIIVPQTKPSGFLLEICLQNNDVLHYKTVQDVIFESGKVYTFNVKVIESNISVETVVTPWEATTDVEEDLML